MMKKQYRYLFLLVAAMALLAGAFYALSDGPVVIETYETAGRLPAIRPDYVGTVIPPNIAPLNFVVDEPGQRYFVRILAEQGEDVEISSKDPKIAIPAGPWAKLLRANREGEVRFDVYAQASNGQWTRFDTITNRIAPDEIDGYLVYRKIQHVAQRFRYMGVYQRSLQDYDESPLLRNYGLGGRSEIRTGCVNCHTFLNNRPDTMLLHVRAASGPNPAPTLLARDGHIDNINTRPRPSARAAGIISWHPTGRLMAFSTNDFQVFMHHSGFNVEAFDFGPDLAVYLMDSNTVTTTPSISRQDRFETYPSWSSDGRHLYFCSAPALPLERYEEVRCDLMRIAYDAETDTWGEPETVLSVSETGSSMTLPRISPDGRFLVFCVAANGIFAPYQPSADLYLMDMETRQYRRLECNSDRAEAWHSWSSNSRWIAFSSRRMDGFFARPYFSYIDEQGRAYKPILLPQKDPSFYDSFLKHFNLPELVMGRVPITRGELVQAINSPDKILKAKPGPSVQPDGVPDVGSSHPARWSD